MKNLRLYYVSDHTNFFRSDFKQIKKLTLCDLQCSGLTSENKNMHHNVNRTKIFIKIGKKSQKFLQNEKSYLQ